MRYAVIYQSKSGNTRLLAEKIYQTIKSQNKVISDLEQLSEIPQADVYFIGFGVRNNSCSIEVINLLEKLENARYALFLTCGYMPTEQYKEALRKHLDVWLPETGTILDMLVCQGKVEWEQRDIMYRQMSEEEETLREMFYYGNNHPDEKDLESAERFVEKIQSIEDHRIPIW